jgi:hypothetical protein
MTCTKENTILGQENSKDCSDSNQLLSALTDCIIPEIIKSNSQLNKTDKLSQALSSLKTIQSIVANNQFNNQKYELYRHCLDRKSGIYLFESAPTEVLETIGITKKINRSCNYDFLRLLVTAKVLEYTPQLTPKSYLINYNLQLVSQQEKVSQPNIIQIKSSKSASSETSSFSYRNKASITAKVFPLDKQVSLCFNTYPSKSGFHSRDISLSDSSSIQKITETLTSLAI